MRTSTSVRLGQATSLQLNRLSLEVFVEDVGGIVVDDNARLGNRDALEIIHSSRQGLDPGLLRDVPPGREVDPNVNWRCAVDAGCRVACDCSGPCRDVAELPGEVCRILCLDITRDGRLRHDGRDPEMIAVALRGRIVTCGMEENI